MSFDLIIYILMSDKLGNLYKLMVELVFILMTLVTETKTIY